MRKLRSTHTSHPTTLAHTVRTAAVDDGMTLLDTRRGTLFHLTHSGAVILSALSEHGATLDAAVTALTRQYDIDRHQARADVVRLVNELGSCGLMTG